MNVVQNVAAPLGWAALLAIAVATLGPIGMRPRLASVTTERVGAFAAVGFLLAIAHPSDFLLVWAVVAAAAIILELCQGLVPGRHARLSDAVAKIAGSMAGVAAAVLLQRILAMAG